MPGSIAHCACDSFVMAQDPLGAKFAFQLGVIHLESLMVVDYLLPPAPFDSPCHLRDWNNRAYIKRLVKCNALFQFLECHFYHYVDPFTVNLDLGKKWYEGEKPPLILPYSILKYYGSRKW
jgi:hypothetical protein